MPSEEPTRAAGPRSLPDSDQGAFELLRAVKRGDAGQLSRILGAEPGLAASLIGRCTPLHYFADAPGHRPNAAAIVRELVAAGADLDAHAQDTWHHETPLHWAASNDATPIQHRTGTRPIAVIGF
jgi:hypothetical protein